MRPAPVLRSIRPELLERAVTGQHRVDDRSPVPIPPAQTLNAAGLAALLGLEVPTSKTRVTDSTVSGLAAVQAGVDMIAHAVGIMLAEAKCYDAGGNEVDKPAIVTRPTPLYGAFEFYVGLVDILMKRGNAPGVLADWGPDAAGTIVPRQVVPAHPGACSLDDSSGIPVWTINGQRYDWDEMLHVRHGAPWGSLWGRGIIERYRDGLQRQLAEQEWGRSGMMSGGVPSAIISLDLDVVDDTQAELVAERWESKQGGATRKPIVIGKMMKVEPISWTPEDAEWVESRKTSVAEAALMCGLHPADLGASLGGALDYANISERQLSRILHSFSPWMRLVEEAMSDVHPGISVRGDAEALLRTSTKERYDTYKIGKEIGLWDEDEIRVAERRPRATPRPTPEVTQEA